MKSGSFFGVLIGFLFILVCSCSGVLNSGRGRLGTQIIADHTVIDDFDTIPAKYVAEAKKMMIWIAGESHSSGYRIGMTLLEATNPAYACNVATGEAATDQYVRVNNSGAGESEWFTWYAYDGHTGANRDSIKNSIKEYADSGHPVHAIGFGWCWDLTRGSASSVDPSFGASWYGSSVDGPDGDRMWGLDANDYAITSNRVSMDTYLEATEDYRTYCANSGYPTTVLFTTGPADLAGETGYQAHLKHEYIRDYIKANNDRILFDYTDILCYNNAGQLNTETWNGHTFPSLHPDNMFDYDDSLNPVTAVEDGDHIGEVAALRLAKAEWWLLARIAGWDGVSTE